MSALYRFVRDTSLYKAFLAFCRRTLVRWIPSSIARVGVSVGVKPDWHWRLLLLCWIGSRPEFCPATDSSPPVRNVNQTILRSPTWNPQVRAVNSSAWVFALDAANVSSRNPSSAKASRSASVKGPNGSIMSVAFSRSHFVCHVP